MFHISGNYCQFHMRLNQTCLQKGPHDLMPQLQGQSFPILFHFRFKVWPLHACAKYFHKQYLLQSLDKVKNKSKVLLCGNKMPTSCNRGFYCRSYRLLNMFRAPLCPSSGAQEYYTVVAACGISCCGFQVAGLVWS